MMEKMIPKTPKNNYEIDKIINISISQIMTAFKESISTFPVSELLKSEIKKSEFLLFSKIKAKEGFFRFLNNFYSFEYIFQLEKFLIRELSLNKMNDSQCIQAYTKLAKGNFVLEGLQIIHDILSCSAEQRLEFLQKKAEITIRELEEHRNELFIESEYKVFSSFKENLSLNAFVHNNLHGNSNGDPGILENRLIDFESLMNS